MTKERLRVPPEFAAEMVPVDPRSGEYRSQYAGYVDSGWGYGRDGKVRGWPLILEMRAYENNLVLEDGKAICKIVFERMAEIPEVVYGETYSHYTNQNSLRLSRHFQL